jgi:hypothetical protein
VAAGSSLAEASPSLLVEHAAKVVQAPRSEDALSTEHLQDEHLQDAGAPELSVCPAAHFDEGGSSLPAPRERAGHQ